MLNTTTHPFLLDPARTALLVIDMQRAFHTYVPGFFQLSDRIRLLIRIAARLGVPVACSEQYPSGLGPTVASIVEDLPEGSPTFDKVEFAACDAPSWDTLPEAIRHAEQFVLVGIEAHVCVRQTALSLLERGREVHVPTDGVASHTVEHRDVSLRELSRAGARETMIEQVAFDWLRRAGTPAFADVQRLLLDPT